MRVEWRTELQIHYRLHYTEKGVGWQQEDATIIVAMASHDASGGLARAGDPLAGLIARPNADWCKMRNTTDRGGLADWGREKSECNTGTLTQTRGTSK